MAKFDIKKLIEKHTKDDEINYEAINEEVNNQANDIIAKQKPNTEALKEEAKQEFLKEHSFDSVEAFKKFVEDKSNLASDELEAIKKEFESYKAETKDYADLKNKEREAQQNEVLTGTKISNKALLNALKVNAEKRLGTDVDFAKAVELELSENPDNYTINSDLTSGKSVRGGSITDEKLGFEKEIERITNIKL